MHLSIYWEYKKKLSEQSVDTLDAFPSGKEKYTHIPHVLRDRLHDKMALRTTVTSGEPVPIWKELDCCLMVILFDGDSKLHLW